MNLEEFEITPEFVLRGLYLVLAVVWILLPGQVAAYSNSMETSLMPFSGCADMGFSDFGALKSRSKQTLSGSFSSSVERRPAFSAAERRAAFTPCEDSDRDSDPQYNICFEGNPAPISTLPHLLAGLQAELASSLVQSTASTFLEKQQDGERLPVGDGRAISVIPRGSGGMPPADRGATCSPSGDMCSALPVLPAGVELASVVPVLLTERLQGVSVDFVGTVDLEQELWARLRVGPAVGHGLLVERPPIVS